MKLSEWLRKYREANGISMNALAVACDVTTSYISLLEKGINPQTGKPFSVSLETIRKIAAGTGHTVQELTNEIDDLNFPPEMNSLSTDEEILITGYRNLNRANKRMYSSLLTVFLNAQSAAMKSV